MNISKPLIRLRLHKSKLRSKFRLPRKLKKQRKKSTKNYHKRLKHLYGEDWMYHIILGG